MLQLSSMFKPLMACVHSEKNGQNLNVFIKMGETKKVTFQNLPASTFVTLFVLGLQTLAVSHDNNHVAS